MALAQVPHAMAQCHCAQPLRRRPSWPCVHSSRALHAPPRRLAAAPRSDEAEVLKFLQKQVQDDIDLSAYNFVRPSIFNVFEKYN